MSEQEGQWEWGHRIKGGVIRQRVRDSLLQQYQDELTAKQLKVEILRFAPPVYQVPMTQEQERDQAKYVAAADSTRVKLSAFSRMGVEAIEREPLPQDMTRVAFEAVINELNQDPSVNAIIVQYPVPPGLEVVIPNISPEKDLDALSEPPGFSVPATAEGIFRVVEPFSDRPVDIQSEAVVRLLEPFTSDDRATVAVVGARGFVGRGVCRLLAEQDIPYLAIDRQNEGFRPEDLLRVREADIVVSATGQPAILDERHITPYHRLVIDCGYVPLGDDRFGDIARSAYGIPQNITPVPGGTGPIEMAILMERLVQKEIDPHLEPWRLQDYEAINYYNHATLEQQQRIWAQQLAPTIRTILDIRQAQLEETNVGVFRLTGSSFNLSLNLNENHVALEGKDNRGELARFSLFGGEVLSASGLTQLDFKLWQKIQRTLQNSLTRRDSAQDFER